MKRLLRITTTLAALMAGVMFDRGNAVTKEDGKCFAFLLKGDVVVSYGGERTQITDFGNVAHFALSDDGSRIAIIRDWDGRRRSSSVATATLVDLHSGFSREIAGQGSIVPTCGGLFWLYDNSRSHSGTVELLSNKKFDIKPYVWFRCSADRRVVVGTLDTAKSDLYEGVPPRTKVASAGSYSFYTFDVSPDGSKTAYFADNRSLCVFSLSGSSKCSVSSPAGPDSPTVNNLGEVLVAYSSPGDCFYKSMTNFSRERFSGATDENQDTCLGIGYWTQGQKSISIIEPLGRKPQWISPAAAKLLRDWRTRRKHTP